ncbi:MAG: LLM class flavin-dependent oxidoreductase [Steroidobacteraceae bacterium]
MALPLSVLDLAPVPSGVSASTALRRTVDLARLADELGFVRLWYAEHHSMPSVGSSAPEVLIANAAAATKRLRLGSGGIMLPNHSPLRVAELFRTLNALHPGRIDLGLGRAPGSDQNASRALRAFDGEQFPYLLSELLAFDGRNGGFPDKHPFHSVRAQPEDAPLPPIWILGSSGASAALAGAAGMGYSFASHFSPTPAAPAFDAYRAAFQPSTQFAEPHAILGVAVCCAETQERAEHLASTMELGWLRIRSGRYLPLPTPEEALAYPYTDSERARIADYRKLTIVGSPETVRDELLRRAAECGASEVMMTSNIHAHAARLRSYELVASALQQSV